MILVKSSVSSFSYDLFSALLITMTFVPRLSRTCSMSSNPNRDSLSLFSTITADNSLLTAIRINLENDFLSLKDIPDFMSDSSSSTLYPFEIAQSYILFFCVSRSFF